MKKNNRIKALASNLLTRADVERMVSEIRALKISERKIKADRDAAVKKIDDGCAPHLDRIQAEVERLVSLCGSWAELHPEEFDKRKSIECTHGVFGFRTGTPKLALLSRAWNWDRVLAAVQSMLPNFIREKPEIDKESLLAQRDEKDIQWALMQCGMKVVQDEAFFVEPDLTETEKREVAA